MGTRWILPLSEIEPDDRGSVGNKAWYLSRMLRAGLPVPRGVAIGREACLAGRETSPAAALPADFWPRLELEVRRLLNLEEGVAVRSSSPSEDTMGRSMAGQFATILRVKSPDELRVAVEACWRSADRGGATGGIGVVVQGMVHAELAGVAFTRDPVDGRRPAGDAAGRAPGDDVVLEFTAGTAERLVSAEMIPYRARVARDDVRTAAGSPELRTEHRSVLLDVARHARKVEELLGFPVDVEWTARGGQVYLVQARPITTGTGAALAAGIPPGAWTRRIAEDLWADPLTAFEEALLLAVSPRFDLRGPARWLGIDLPDERRVLAGIGSYLYLSCDVLDTVVRELPGFLRVDQIAAMFPPDRDPRALPQPAPLRVARAALGAAALSLSDPEANPLSSAFAVRKRTEPLAAEAHRLDAVDVAQLSDAALGDHLGRCLALFGNILASEQFGYLWAFVFSWGADWAGRLTGISREAWLRHLGGEKGNATQRMERLLEEVGEGLRQSGIATDGHTFDAVVAELTARGFPQAADAARKLLSEFGVRASQRSLVAPRWAEEPLLILEQARRFARKESGHNHDGVRRLPVLVRALLAMANRHLDLREDQRFLIDSALFAIRRCVLEVGRRHGLDGDSFFLRPDEVEQLLGGALPVAEARSRAAERHARYRAAGPPPAFWVDGHPVRGQRPRQGANQIFGVGASPGLATGRVRVVERFEEAIGIEKGDVVVAPLMGPAWTPLLRIAGGVITEKGGLLDHFAILAREAAVPAVTGAEGAIEALRGVKGATVDGTRGVVSW